MFGEITDFVLMLPMTRLACLQEQAGKFERNSLQSMTQSHRCWFIRNIWKSDHRLNMTLGTDIKFTLSFLSAKLLC